MTDPTLAEVLIEIWKQTLVDGVREVEVAGQRASVERSASKGLRIVKARFGETEIEGIEQNPKTRSRWAALAQEGQRIMQFSAKGRYFANVGEGKVTRYPAWEALGLSD